MAYPNGRVPLHLLVKHGEHYFFPGTFARWVELQRRVHDECGVWLYITPGPNAYRLLSEQKRMRAELGVGAALPGTSSHGGVWTGQTKGHSGLPTWVTGRESGAIDIGNWFEVPWDVLTKHARAVGFIPDIVVPTEKWHFVDLNPWQVPTFGTAADVQEDDMPLSEEDLDRIAERVWSAKVGRGNNRRTMSQVLTELPTKIATAVWGAEVGRGANRRKMSQVLADIPGRAASAVWGAWFGRELRRETAGEKLTRAAGPKPQPDSAEGLHIEVAAVDPADVVVTTKDE